MSQQTDKAAPRPDRLFHLDILRVVAAFGIVVLHVSASATVRAEGPSSADWWIANLFDSATRWSLPAFVLVSGALLLHRGREDLLVFYKKRLSRIFIPTVSWSVLFLAWEGYSGRLTGASLADRLLHGMPSHHMWFLFMICGLYLFTPALRAFVGAATPQERLWTLVIMFVLSSAYHAVLILGRGTSQPTILTLFVPYFAYYVCGYHLKALGPGRTPLLPLLGAAAFGVLTVAGGTGLLLDCLGRPQGYYLYNYFSPPVILTAIAMFQATARLGELPFCAHPWVRSAVSRLAPATLGIYLMHVPLFSISRKIPGMNWLTQMPLVSIPLISISVFAVCYLATDAIRKIPFVRRIV